MTNKQFIRKYGNHSMNNPITYSQEGILDTIKSLISKLTGKDKKKAEKALDYTKELITERKDMLEAIKQAKEKIQGKTPKSEKFQPKHHDKLTFAGKAPKDEKEIIDSLKKTQQWVKDASEFRMKVLKPIYDKVNVELTKLSKLTDEELEAKDIDTGTSFETAYLLGKDWTEQVRKAKFWDKAYRDDDVIDCYSRPIIGSMVYRLAHDIQRNDFFEDSFLEHKDAGKSYEIQPCKNPEALISTVESLMEELTSFASTNYFYQISDDLENLCEKAKSELLREEGWNNGFYRIWDQLWCLNIADHYIHECMSAVIMYVIDSVEAAE